MYNYSATIIIVNSVQHSKCWQHNYDCTVNVIGIQLSPCMFPRFLVLSLPNPVAFSHCKCVCWNLNIDFSVKGLSL